MNSTFFPFATVWSIDNALNTVKYWLRNVLEVLSNANKLFPINLFINILFRTKQFFAKFAQNSTWSCAENVRIFGNLIKTLRILKDLKNCKNFPKIPLKFHRNLLRFLPLRMVANAFPSFLVHLAKTCQVLSRTIVRSPSFVFVS